MDHYLRPAFAAGHVYSSSVIDTLLAQAYYNPHVITILRLLIAGVDLAFAKRWDKRMEPRLGNVKESHMFEMVVPKALARLLPQPSAAHGVQISELLVLLTGDVPTTDPAGVCACVCSPVQLREQALRVAI